MPGDFRKYAVEAFRQMDEGAAHPTMQEIDAHLHGNLPDGRRTAMEAHLAQCADCRERVSEFQAFLKDCEQPAAIPQRTLKEEYGRLASRLPPSKVTQMPRRWLALAAAVILPLGLAAAIWRLTPSTPRLLAQAYRERRTSEFRIAGAMYAELRQERGGGSAFSMPGSLLKAQARIQDDLKAHENDPELLRLEGEAQIIGGDAAGAVKSLSRARDLRSGDAQILSDLGSAYSILGDVEHDFDDYKQGLDLLDQSLRLGSRNSETLFNRAVVLEKLMLPDQAEIAWNDYLKSDPAGDWAKEARQRLAAIKQKMQQREKKLGEVRDDPAYFLKLAAADDVDAEAWLISPISAAWLVRSRADANARQAVLQLADILSRKHGDTWLRDMRADSCTSPVATTALAKLLDADAQASAGQYGAALIASEDAAGEFLRAGCGAGAIRARLSVIGAEQNSGRTAECSSSADQLNRELRSRSYFRIRARLARASAVCGMRLGRLDEADATLRQALQMSRAAGYGATSLDLLNVTVGRTSAPGLPSQMVANAAEALRIFWSGTYRRDLMYAPVYELRLFANRAEQKGAALYFARSAVWATRDSILMYQVQTYSALGVAEIDLGMMQEAGADLETSNRLAAKLPDEYRVAPAVALAKLDLDRGNASQALERLLPWADIVPRMPVVDRAGYGTALGDSLARNGALADAVAAYRKITDSSVAYLASVKSGDERDGVLKGIEGAYRGLVDAQLATPGNEAAALATWQSFRALETPPGSPVHAANEDPVLWYVELPDGFAIWCTRQGHTVFHRMEAPKTTVAAVAERFLKESSDPQSSVDATRDDARTLYRWMVAPFRSVLGTVGQNLIVEPDGALGALPLQSLLAEDGSYLGDRYAVLISAGRAGRAYAPTPAGAQVLVVANPLITGASAMRFPPLPDTLREAQTIRSTFGKSALLEGREASLEALTRELPHADILHFAGHGYSSSGNGGFLLAPADPAVTDYRLVGASDLRSMDWSRCSLAVLSACAAAEGETRGAHNPESLIRALAKAGVPRIAASLWNADSAATAELMSQFYGSLKRGCQPTEALRTAQQALRRNSRWQHPYYWAGFQLYGTT